MNGDTTARILKAFTGRWIEKSETDTKRSLRKLVEFGCCFSGSDKLRNFFGEARNILSNNKSEYYRLTRGLVKSVDKNRIKEFGIGFGYYGLAKGIKKSVGNSAGSCNEYPLAEIIGGREKYCADNAIDRICSLADRGTSIFFIFCDGTSDVDIGELKETVDKYPQKTFFIFTGNPETAEDFSQKNAMPVLDVAAESFSLCAERLKKQKRLFGGYSRFGDKNAGEIICCNFLERICGKGCYFLFLVEGDACSENTRKMASEFGYKQKRRPNFPIFVTELFGDIDWLNEKAGTKKSDREEYNHNHAEVF